MSDNSTKTAVIGRPFVKGQSGNPHGRPKAEGKVRAYAQRKGMAAIKKLFKLMNDDNPRVAVVAAQAVLDRAFGKSPQAFELPDGNFPTLIRIEFVQAPSESRKLNGEQRASIEFVQP